MDPSFGARLRSQRERQQVALSTIAEQTKIRAALLEELERDDVSHWPSGVFRRAYIRAYAQAIGLDPDTIVREFLALYPDPLEEVSEALAVTVGSSESTRRRPPTRLRFLIGSALGALPVRRGQPAATSGMAGAGIAFDPRRQSLEHDVLDHHEFEDDLLEVSGIAVPAAEMAEADDRGVHLDHDVAAVAPAVSVRPEALASHEQPSARLDLSAMADLCTRLARTADPGELTPALADAAALLGAVGMILWMWDAQASALRAVLSHGYSDQMLAHLPAVPLDTDNAIAAAFRSAAPRVVNGNDAETGAVVVPLTTPTGCAGVLALELRDGGERHEGVRAFAVILAAQLSTLIECPPMLHAATG
jgi:hypothetical protein